MEACTTTPGTVELSPQEMQLMRLCSAMVDLGVTVADGEVPGFERNKREDLPALREHVQTLTRGVEIPLALAAEIDAARIVRNEFIACTNAAMMQRPRDRAWQRADGPSPWRDRHIRRAWKTLLMRLADAGYRVPGDEQIGLVTRSEAPECYRLADDEFRTGWIAAESRPYQWCARRRGDTFRIGRRELGSRSFETLLDLPLIAVEPLATFLGAIV